jgi:hypothetical protein
MIAACPVCRQGVAVDAAGIRPHQRHGSPCAGGRAATLPRPAPKAPMGRPKLTARQRADSAAAKQRAKDEAARARKAKAKPERPAPVVLAKAPPSAPVAVDADAAVARDVAAELGVWGRP